MAERARAKSTARGVAIAAALFVFGAIIRAQERAPILVLPFENKTREADYHWVGEACSLFLSDLLAQVGESVVSPDDRRAAYEQLRLPEGLVLTRASALLVAEQLGAERLVMGTYQVSGAKGQERLTLTARVIRVSEARMLTNELTLGAPLQDLPSLLGALVGEVLGDRLSAAARQDMKQRAATLPVSVLELFAKARMAADPQIALQFLRRAEQAAKGKVYAPLLLELGRTYAQQKQCAEAVSYLRRLSHESPAHREAQFYLGVCAIQQQEWDRALEIYRALARAWPLAEVYNNLALVELRLGQVEAAVSNFSRAVERAETDPDIRFNYGYALWKHGDFENALVQLRHVVRRRPADGEAHYLLGKSWHRLGREEEAQGALALARRYLPQFAEWEKVADPPIVPRLKMRLSRRGEGGSRGLLSRAPMGRPSEAVREAEALLESGRDEEALAILEGVLRTRPDWAEAHLLKARLYLRRGNWREAADAAHAAAFWNPQSASAHLLLARIYLAVGERERARLSVERALALDPNNVEARELGQSLGASPRKP
ncbi:MAG: tetratricopeptide repeat protein [Blastocatellia bacterium]|nr:tetratricopeptide repeat protein [Blastocatellia bacterium]MCS7158315.1 tetratricopeptide repeat protein [Blastocatellia bacterium]MDW8169468.1 tetratricopeptide repeat protein [Acidobacteriota bacterium]MDW8255742.1 tetratricopeptide repeat protein [Acidobacteriota bacterium]